MKQEEKTQITRKKILDAALEEFGTNGYASGSVNNICKTGINKGLVYHNYKNKDELYLKCVEESCKELVQYVLENHAEKGFVEYMSVRMQFFQEYVPEGHIFLEARTNPPIHLFHQIQMLFTEFDELNRNVFEQELSGHTLRQGVSKEDALNYFYEIQKMYNLNFANHLDGNMTLDEQVLLHETNIRKVLDLMLYGIAKGEDE